MTKFYRVLKDNFLWAKGAILENDCGIYLPTSDVWDVNEGVDQGINADIIEKNKKEFERVYEINTLNKVQYLGKEEAQDIMSKQKAEGPAKEEDTEDASDY